VPIQYEVCADDATTGHAGDYTDFFEPAKLSKRGYHTQMKQGRPKTAAREC